MSSVKKLNTWLATAICGNDITSSCLYVSALTIAVAGQYAWISLLIVAVVLYLFRKIYGEVVGALPLNGGAYNVLLVIVIALLAMGVALYGNVKMRPVYMVVFMQYFIPAMLLIYAMLNRNHILNFFLYFLKTITDLLRKFALLFSYRVEELGGVRLIL